MSSGLVHSAASASLNHALSGFSASRYLAHASLSVFRATIRTPWTKRITLPFWEPGLCERLLTLACGRRYLAEMAIQLNHTIVLARDRDASARFFVDIFGFAPAKQFGPF